VGRSRELEQLEKAFARAVDGSAGMVLVGGDAGIGKTRLVAEFAARVHDRARVLVGGCVELGEGTSPYAPVVDVLRQLTSDSDGERLEALFGSARTTLARLLPEMVTSGEDDLQIAGTGAQGRLFEALLAVFVRLGELDPMVVVLEDLHWADASTRELLVYLARKLRHGRFLLVGTFRADELHRQHPLRRLLAELERSARVERLELRGFDRAELREQLTGILGASPAAEMIDSVLARSEGNAFFVEELIAGGDPHGGLSPTFRDVVLARVEALPNLARQALRAASVVGRRVEHGLLVEAAGLSEDDLEQGVRAALDAQVIVTDPSGEGYVFRHALSQEAIYGDLLPGERRRLHTRVAEVLARQPVPAGVGGARQAAELAHHWYAARELPEALATAVRAGRLAEGVDAPAEARAQYERALDLWEKVPDAEPIAGCDYVALLERAGDTALLDGAPDQAVRSIVSALAQVDPLTDPRRAALLHEQLGWCHVVRADMESASAAWARARRLLEGEPPSADQARVMAGQARGLMHQLRHAESADLAGQALALAIQVEDRMLEGRARCILGTSLAAMGRVDEGLSHLEQSRTIATTEGSAQDLLAAYANICEALDAAAGRTNEAVKVAREGIAAAQRLGVMGMGVHVVAYGTEALLRLGRWTEAEEMASLALLEEEHTSAAIRRSHVVAALEIRRGQLHQARSRIDKMAAFCDRADGEEWARFHSRQAELALWEGDYDAALSAARAGLSVIVAGDNELYGHELCVYAVRAAIGQARPPAEVTTLVDQTRQLCRRPFERGGAPSPDALVNALVIEAEFSRARTPDPNRWADVADQWAELTRPYDFAYAKWREGEAVLVAQGSRPRATRAFGEAYGTAVELGAAQLATEIQQVAIRTRIDLEAPVAQLPPAKSAGAAFGLTARETEVLALLGLGRTNREIAEELFISEKTASVHVSNILRKLGVTSRFEAARVGQELGYAVTDTVLAKHALRPRRHSAPDGA
jgi:DNA-binding CsgD family transcriptional regulator